MTNTADPTKDQSPVFHITQALVDKMWPKLPNVYNALFNYYTLLAPEVNTDLQGTAMLEYCNTLTHAMSLPAVLESCAYMYVNAIANMVEHAGLIEISCRLHAPAKHKVLATIVHPTAPKGVDSAEYTLGTSGLKIVAFLNPRMHFEYWSVRVSTPIAAHIID